MMAGTENLSMRMFGVVCVLYSCAKAKYIYMDLVTYLVCARPSAAEPPSSDEPPDVVRSGIVRVKRDGLFAGWREKWMVLQGDTLTFYNTGVGVLCLVELTLLILRRSRAE